MGPFPVKAGIPDPFRIGTGPVPAYSLRIPSTESPRAMNESTPRQTRIRVAGLIIRGQEILLAEHEKAGRRYWLLPGGGVEYGESLEEALERELIEEAGLPIRVEELLWTLDSIPPDRHRHVLNVVLRDTPLGDRLSPTQDRVLRDVVWMPIADIPELTLYPEMKQEILGYLQTGQRGSGLLGKRWA